MIYRDLPPNDFEYGADVFALDYYKPDSNGKDDFSRKQTWFYIYGDDDLKQEFEEKTTELVNTLFTEDKTDWNVITPVPAQNEGEINTNMRNLIKEVSDNTGLNYSEVMNRSSSIAESHELESKERRKINIQSSLKIEEDVEGKNIIIMDNVTRSGITLSHTVSKLKQNGANKVACITLGVSSEKNTDRDTTIGEGETATDLMKKPKLKEKPTV